MLDPGESNASARGFVDEAERYVPVEIPVNRGEVGKRRRPGEELEGQPVTGIIGVEQVAREGEQAPTVLGPPIRVDRVVFFEPRCGFWVLERRKSEVTQIWPPHSSRQTCIIVFSCEQASTRPVYRSDWLGIKRPPGLSSAIAIAAIRWALIPSR